jgi:putative membrane protein
MKLSYEQHAKTLLVVFSVYWLALAIDPTSRQDWMLENVLVVPVFSVLLWGWRHRLFSKVSHSVVFIFFCFHEIGAHYTYSLVPYDQWWKATTGTTFNEIMGWQRNHYDRAVHFLYGLLGAYPYREIFLRVARVRGFWAYFLPIEIMLSTSALFEVIEWGTSLVFGGDLGDAYLGTQGDIWDPQKDMALAALGALIAMVVIAYINKHYQRDFAREWSRSLEVAVDDGADLD